MPESVDDLMSKYPLPGSKPKGDNASSVDDLMSKYPIGQADPHSLGDKAQAALEGYGNAVSVGTLPILQAAAQSSGLLYPDPNAKLNEELKAKGIKIDEPEYGNFKTELAQNLARNDRQAKEMPTQYYGGQLAGTAQGLVAAAPLGAKVISAAGKAALHKAQELGPSGLIKAGLGYLAAKHLLNGHGE